ncbi:MAG: hypothetical protein K2N25_06005 [Muribaculaceae bacterium]|nr:hypothetical protein [Muribaculaceae bacterium]
MENFGNFIIHLDSEDLRTLESVNPDTIVVDSLTEALECYSYTRQHSNSNPKISFYDGVSYGEDDFEFLPLGLPRVIVELMDPFISRFFIRIDISRSDYERYSEAFSSSAFGHYFKTCDYGSVQGLYSIFEADVLIFARLITYYFRLIGFYFELTGFSKPDSLRVNKQVDVSKGDMSLAVISDDIKVPETFRRAFAKVKELDIQEEDRMYIRLLTGNPKNENESMEIHVWKEGGDLFFSEQQKVGDRDDLEHRREYRNFDCISFYIHTKIYNEFMVFSDPDFMMQFLTDYFLFLYPHVRPEDIATSMICVEENGYEDVNYIEYFFYPDGSEDSPEKLEDFIMTMHNWRAIEVDTEGQ